MGSANGKRIKFASKRQAVGIVVDVAIVVVCKMLPLLYCRAEKLSLLQVFFFHRGLLYIKARALHSTTYTDAHTLELIHTTLCKCDSRQSTKQDRLTNGAPTHTGNLGWHESSDKAKMYTNSYIYRHTSIHTYAYMNN